MEQKDSKILTPDKNCEPESKKSNTPYDDVFRTMVNDCQSLIIPVINTIFHEHFALDDCIEFDRDIHMVNRQNGMTSKRITDSCFTIKSTNSKKLRFLFECQSTPDSSMLIRIFEYATQIALDEGERGNRVLYVTFPKSAVLFLRGHKKDFIDMEIRMLSPDSEYFQIKVHELYSQDYTLDKIFEMHLLFLLPFYIFNYEQWMKRRSNTNSNQENPDKLNMLLDEYRKIIHHLDDLLDQGKITAYARKIIIEMTIRVIESLAQAHPDIVKEVKSIMGGQVLDYEAKRIYQEGESEGLRKGESIGLRKGESIGELNKAKKAWCNMHALGFEDSTIAKILDISIEQIQEWNAEKA